MTDITPGTRRDMIETGQLRADLAAGQGQTWTTRQLTADFEVRGFSAPFAVGSLEFTHLPRVYFGWRADA